MKKIILSCLLLLSFSYGFACDTEKILRFDVLTQINTDSSVTVRERIIVCSTSQQIKRGIIRSLAKKGLDRYEILSVARNGKTENFSKTENSKTLALRIGDPNKIISKGIHTYDIHYRVLGSLRYHNNFDEFYWNVTGNEWTFEIEKSSVHVALPKGASLVKNGVSLYAGYPGEKGYDRTAQSVKNLFFYTTTPLDSGEGFTVSIAWNKGAVIEPSWLKKNFTWPPSLFMWWLLLLVYYVLIWYWVGRDPKSKVIRQFAPPEGISPAQMIYLAKMSVCDSEGVLAIILMSLQEKKKVRLNVKTVELLSSLEDTQDLSLEEKIVLEGMFSDGKTVFELDKKNARTMAPILDQSFASLKEWGKPFFSTNFWYNLPSFVFLFFLLSKLIPGISIAAIFPVCFLIGIVLCKSRNVALNLIFIVIIFILCDMYPEDLDPMLPLLVILYMIPGFLFSRWIPAYSVKGRLLMDKTEGFAEYIQVAEEHRVFASDPSRAGFMFCQYFPYAMALGLENEWKYALVSQLGKMEAEKQVDIAGGNWDSVTNLSSMHSSLFSMMSSSNGGDSGFDGGDSGFDGGGCSGGGSGGGGGSGW